LWRALFDWLCAFLAALSPKACPAFVRLAMRVVPRDALRVDIHFFDKSIVWGNRRN
jgi:hypothetical protein